MAHYHIERNHQGLGNQLIKSSNLVTLPPVALFIVENGSVVCSRITTGKRHDSAIQYLDDTSLIAATALVHGFIVVTRNTRDFRKAGVKVLDPFA